MENEIIGTNGPIVDLLNNELTQEEWNALCIIHKLTNRLNIQILFRYSSSIDVISTNESQIVDDSVYLNKYK